MIRLSPYEFIFDEELFVKGHRAMIDNEDMPMKIKEPYIQRLERYFILVNEKSKENIKFEK
jgi:hypothetical protein